MNPESANLFNRTTESTAGQPQAQPTTQTQSVLATIQRDIAWLKWMMACVVVSSLALGAAFGIFIMQQTSMANRQKTESRRMLAEFHSNTVPRIEFLIRSLQAFAATNPEYAQIFSKHITIPPSAGSGAAQRIGSGQTMPREATVPIQTTPPRR